MADKVFAEIEGGAKPALKPTETVDKSAPVISADVKVKKVDRGAFLADVSKGTDLKHADTVDKSGPVIAEDLTVKKSERPALLSEIVQGKDLKTAK